MRTIFLGYFVQKSHQHPLGIMNVITKFHGGSDDLPTSHVSRNLPPPQSQQWYQPDTNCDEALQDVSSQNSQVPLAHQQQEGYRSYPLRDTSVHTQQHDINDGYSQSLPVEHPPLPLLSPSSQYQELRGHTKYQSSSAPNSYFQHHHQHHQQQQQQQQQHHHHQQQCQNDTKYSPLETSEQFRGRYQQHQEYSNGATQECAHSNSQAPQENSFYGMYEEQQFQSHTPQHYTLCNMDEEPASGTFRSSQTDDYVASLTAAGGMLRQLGCSGPTIDEFAAKVRQGRSHFTELYSLFLLARREQIRGIKYQGRALYHRAIFVFALEVEDYYRSGKLSKEGEQSILSHLARDVGLLDKNDLRDAGTLTHVHDLALLLRVLKQRWLINIIMRRLLKADSCTQEALCRAFKSLAMRVDSHYQSNAAPVEDGENFATSIDTYDDDEIDEDFDGHKDENAETSRQDDNINGPYLEGRPIISPYARSYIDQPLRGWRGTPEGHIAAEAARAAKKLDRGGIDENLPTKDEMTLYIRRLRIALTQTRRPRRLAAYVLPAVHMLAGNDVFAAVETNAHKDIAAHKAKILLHEGEDDSPTLEFSVLAKRVQMAKKHADEQHRADKTNAVQRREAEQAAREERFRQTFLEEVAEQKKKFEEELPILQEEWENDLEKLLKSKAINDSKEPGFRYGEVTAAESGFEVPNKNWSNGIYQQSEH